MSKSYSLAGLRIGFAVAPAGIIRGFMKIKDSYNVDMLATAGAVAALKDKRGFTYNLEMVVSNKEYLEESLAALGFAVVPSRANFIFVRHPDVLIVGAVRKAEGEEDPGPPLHRPGAVRYDPHQRGHHDGDESAGEGRLAAYNGSLMTLPIVLVTVLRCSSSSNVIMPSSNRMKSSFQDPHAHVLAGAFRRPPPADHHAHDLVLAEDGAARIDGLHHDLRGPSG